jgi:sugar fermentation stimulation protein A
MIVSEAMANAERYEFQFAWPGELIEAKLIRRYHRFLADVELASGEVVVAHCVNSGRMEGLVVKGARVWLTKNKPGGKLTHTWQMIELDGVKIGANTSLPNPLVQAMVRGQYAEDGAPKNPTPWFAKAKRSQFEVAYGAHSRVDAVLHEDDGKMNLVEVKNVHLVYPDGGAYFPDSVSERATKHMRELTALAREGERATVLFVIQHPAAKFVRPSDVHDPEFAKAAREAGAAGVKILALVFEPTDAGLKFAREIPVDLAEYDVTEAKGWMEALKSTTGWERPKSAKTAEGDEGGEEAGGATKKSATKKSATKKSATKKSATKKSAVKKSAVKKSAVKKSAVKKP